MDFNPLKNINSLMGEPWMIDSVKADGFWDLVARVRSGESSFTDFMPDGDPVADLGQRYRVEDGVAHVELDGVIGRKLDWLDKALFGMVDLDDVLSSMNEAAEDSTVDEIQVNIDSPGGAAIGMVEAMREVRRISEIKPVVSQVDRAWGASAAYFFAAGSTEIRMSESSKVGSIGTIVAGVDVSERMRLMGMKPIVARNDEATLKSPGYGGEKLSAEQLAEIQRGVNAFHEISRDLLFELRPQIDEAALNGTMFTSREAIELGLVDSVI